MRFGFFGFMVLGLRSGLLVIPASVLFGEVK